MKCKQLVPLRPLRINSIRLLFSTYCRLVFFQGNCKELEGGNKGKEFGDFWTDEIFSRAKACVLLAVAGLEAFVNETFIHPDCSKYFQGVDASKMFGLIEKLSILDKFDLALSLMKADHMDTSKGPAQDIKLLIDLRNALTHYKAEWGSKRDKHDKLSKKLRVKFPVSTIFSKDEPLFPFVWASHGCAEWAIKSTIAFIEAFETQAKMHHRFEKFKEKFKC